jgi:hypothetical protein
MHVEYCVSSSPVFSGLDPTHIKFQFLRVNQNSVCACLLLVIVMTDWRELFSVCDVDWFDCLKHTVLSIWYRSDGNLPPCRRAPQNILYGVYSVYIKENVYIYI